MLSEKSSIKLNYSIVIATYNRLDALTTAVGCILEQTFLPNELIIVDASPEFDRNKTHIINAFNFSDINIQLSYQKANKASLTIQRNQGIKRLKPVDVVFLLDDDSFMESDCAEKVMEVYSQDDEKKIAGAQCSLMPNFVGQGSNIKECEINKLEKKPLKTNSALGLSLKNKCRFLWREIFLMGATKVFIPYDGIFHWNKKSCEHSELMFPIELMHGCRMTYRYEVLTPDFFDTDLVSYSAGEDLDASYRASRVGILVECVNARLYHHTVAASRLSRYKSIRMACFNNALFLSKHSNNLVRDRKRYITLTLRRLLAEILKDTLSCRFSYPQLRGVWSGSIMGLKVLFKREQTLKSFSKYQKQLL